MNKLSPIQNTLAQQATCRAVFHSHKILPLALLGPFTDRNDTDFSTLSYTSTIEIPTLSYT